jgi:hypothetical protein
MVMKKRKTTRRKPVKKALVMRTYQVKSKDGIGFVRATSTADAIKKLKSSRITAYY